MVTADKHRLQISSVWQAVFTLLLEQSYAAINSPSVFSDFTANTEAQRSALLNELCDPAGSGLLGRADPIAHSGGS